MADIKTDDKTPAASASAAATDAGKKTGDAAAAAAAKPDTTAAATDTSKKPDGTAAAEPASTAGAASDAPKAPEKYTLTLPEGGRFDTEDLKAFESVARAQDLTNEAAQQMLAEHAAAIDAQTAHFLEQTKADTTYGGEKLADTQRLAKLVLDKVRPVGTPHGDALRAMFEKTGYGNHLEVISFLADLGKLMDEDGGAAGTSGASARQRDAATVLYGGTAKAS